jgi:hypothetical protein
VVNATSSAVMLLSAEGLVVCVSGGDYELLGGGVEDGLLNVVGVVRQAGELYREGDDVLGIIHVCVDVDADDLLRGGAERYGHLVAGLGVVLEDDVRGA